MKKNLLNIVKLLPGAHKGAIPKIIYPELCTSATPPVGDHWLHEMKFDGYRIIAIIKNNQVKLISRNQKDWTEKFPEVVRALQRFSKTNLILDGELVALDAKGTSRFQLLQNSLETHAKVRLAYYIFDIIYFASYSLTRVPLLDRKQFLLKLLGKPPKKIATVNYSPHIIGQGEKIYTKACKRGLEGIISKRIDSLYEQRRTKDWIKSKCLHQQEFVIGGYTNPGGARQYFGALLLGFYDKNKRLIFAGHVGTGFNQKSLQNLYRRMKPLVQKTSAFYQIPRFKNVHWLKPKLVAEVEFLEWTKDGSLRHPSFKGLREDKSAKQVKFEP